MGEIAAEYEIHPTQLHKWKAEALDHLPSLFTRGASETEKMRKQYEKEKDQLTQQIGQLSVELNWLKKNLTNSTSVEERKEMMDRHDAKLSVKRQSELLEMSRTSVYYLPVNRDDDLAIMHRIDEIYTRWPLYGHRRICNTLQNEGIVISKKKTCRLMRKMGLAGLCPGPNLSKRNHKQAIHPYLLRGVKAEHPNHIWGIDITYLRMQGNFMYLVAIIDWYSRYIVSWELSQSLERSFVLRALKKAFTVGKPKILNSDQGSHFTSSDYIELLQTNEITISMDGKGRATDNAITERFFRKLKWEKIYYNTYTTPKQVYRDVRAYIDEYNRTRPHQSLDYAKPLEFYQHTVDNVG